MRQTQPTVLCVAVLAEVAFSVLSAKGFLSRVTLKYTNSWAKESKYRRNHALIKTAEFCGKQQSSESSNPGETFSIYYSNQPV